MLKGRRADLQDALDDVRTWSRILVLHKGVAVELDEF